ncbi:hypothetical protein BKA70DRAFT_1226049 [Coprinopsis sp. MPI-PUGE-AT-0042]|nr:hypothetical protein BKA70DRAFT_1226049 [Coprinopsis sp. MPI-PUGE-AT-0042]
MRRTSLLSSLATVAVCAAMVGRAHAQACDCEGAVATLYDGSNDCDPARRVKSCTWMIPNRCCSDTRGYPPTYYYYHSASMHGIENLPDGDAGWSIGTRDQMCRRAVALHGNGCINQGGEKTVLVQDGIFAGTDLNGLGRLSTDSGKIPIPALNSEEGKEECQGRVTPDVVFIREKADEAGRPFGESMVLKAFGDADVVDWYTLTVKEGKLDLFHELTATYGDGLSRSQMQAMRILAEEDAKRGVLSSAMSRFLTEDLSLTGQRRICRSPAEL